MENQQAHLFPISTIASQLKDDVRSIYATQIRMLSTGRLPGGMVRSETNFKIPNRGELVVIASRDKGIRQNLIFWLSRRIALENKQVVAIYSANNYSIQFARDLVGDLSDISSDTDIYAGELSGLEVQRVNSLLNLLIQSEIYVHSGLRRSIEDILETARALTQERGEIGLVIVDALQFMTPKSSNIADTLQSLICLKSLAVQINVPVVALYHLDPGIEDHPSTLTRIELREVEQLAEKTDGVMLMSKQQNRIVFASPKIPNAKPIYWVE